MTENTSKKENEKSENEFDKYIEENKRKKKQQEEERKKKNQKVLKDYNIK